MRLGQSRIAPYFSEVDGLLWKDGKTTLSSSVRRHLRGETEVFELKIFDVHTQKTLYARSFSIDWDMGGGGFLKAVQVDDDPELEVLFVTRGQEEDIFLDIKDGQVRERSYDLLSPEAKKLAEKWLRYHAVNPFCMALAIVLTGVYYLVGVVVFLIIWKKSKRAQGDAS